MIQELVLSGKVVSKKNLLKFSSRRRTPYYDDEVKQLLLSFDRQVSEQWGLRPPLEHPAVWVLFYVASELSDKDGAYTTIQDALVNGGVLTDDCVKHNNGDQHLGRAYVSKWHGARVFIDTGGDFGSLLRHVESLPGLEGFSAGQVQCRPRTGFRK